MSLDISLVKEESITAFKCPNCGYQHQKRERDVLYSGNITHNLGSMASAAGIYDALWRPYRLHPDFKPLKSFSSQSFEEELQFEESIVILAKDILPLLIEGLGELKEFPDFYKTFDSENGWGTYEDFIPFIEEYIEACEKYPEAKVVVSR